MTGESLKGHLDLLLLSLFRGGAAHGYSVVERLATESGGAFDLPEGTVYPALHRLEGRGQLRSRWKVVAGRRRRVYELTPEGRRALVDAFREWTRFSSAVQRVAESGR